MRRNERIRAVAIAIVMCLTRDWHPKSVNNDPPLWIGSVIGVVIIAMLLIRQAVRRRQRAAE